MENNESEKQNFKFPERWGVCAIILLPFLFFISAIAYITEFSNLTQYFVSCAILSVAIWFYYDVIKIFELMENVVRDEKTLKLLNEEKKENERLRKRVSESEKDKDETIKTYEERSKAKDGTIKTYEETIKIKNQTIEIQDDTIKKYKKIVDEAIKGVKKLKKRV